MPGLDTNLFKESAISRFRNQAVPPGTNRERFHTWFGQAGQALAGALDRWRRQALLQGVVVVGPTASNGVVTGMDIEVAIRDALPADWAPYNRALAAGFNAQFQRLVREMKVPGLAWYPPFANFPGPAAPPIANRPSPLMALCGNGMRWVEPDAIKAAIISKYPSPRPECGDAVAHSVSQAFTKALVPWLGGTMVQQVMGGGVVSGFAPPVRLTGQVIGTAMQLVPGGMR